MNPTPVGDADKRPLSGKALLQQAVEAPSDERILEIAHRTASRYTHRSDPTDHSYGFVRHTLLDFVRKVLAESALQQQEGKGEAVAPAQRMTEAELNAQSWWCPHCVTEVPPEMVTKDGEHYLESGGCGRPVRGERINDALAPSPSTAVQQEAGSDTIGAEGWKRIAQSALALVETDKSIKEISARYGLDTPNAETIAEAIHYPDCWDQAAYPTVASALKELTAWFKCSTCAAAPTQPQVVQQEAGSGWRLVPVEPTPEMLHAIALRFAFTPEQDDLNMAAEGYRAMLAAAPTQQPPSGSDGGKENA